MVPSSQLKNKHNNANYFIYLAEQYNTMNNTIWSHLQHNSQYIFGG